VEVEAEGVDAGGGGMAVGADRQGGGEGGAEKGEERCFHRMRTVEMDRWEAGRLVRPQLPKLKTPEGGNPLKTSGVFRGAGAGGSESAAP